MTQMLRDIMSTLHRQLYPAVCEKSMYKALLSVV